MTSVPGFREIPSQVLSWLINESIDDNLHPSKQKALGASQMVVVAASQALWMFQHLTLGHTRYSIQMLNDNPSL